MKTNSPALRALMMLVALWICTVHVDDWLIGAEWIIDTVAGNGQAQGTASAGRASEVAIGDPFGVEIGPDGKLYVTEVRNHRLWKVDVESGHAQVIAGTGQRGYRGDGGPAETAWLNEPYEVRFDGHGNLYVVEMQNHVVRRIDRRGIIETIAGTGEAGFGGDGGPARNARLRQPHSIVVDPAGRWLLIADIGNHRIRRVNLETGIIESVAGNGERQLPRDGQPASATPVLGPRALYLDTNSVWVALREGHSVWRLEGVHPFVWKHVAGTGRAGFAGDGQAAQLAQFNGPKGIAVDKRGNVYIADTENHAIRCIDALTGIVITIAGRGPQSGGFAGDGGPATAARLHRPHGICVASDQTIFVGDTLNHRVRRIRYR